MPLVINLPTIAAVDFGFYFREVSTEGENAITALQDSRAQLRNRLKAFKRANELQKKLQLQELLTLAENYYRELARLQQLLDSKAVETIAELATQWTAIPDLLPQTIPSGKHLGKTSIKGLPSELAQTTFLLGLVHFCIGNSFEESPDNTPLLKRHTANLTTSASIFCSLSVPAARALAELAHAEATLLAVLPMDPYPSYLSVTTAGGIIKISAGDHSGKEWLYTPPPKPKGVKALLIARLCIAASDHAIRAGAYIQDDKGMGKLKKYSEKLSKEAKAKACRFLGVDAEGSGRAGEGIGWIKAGRLTLKGHECEEEEILKELEARWTSANDKYGFEKVINEKELLSKVPSGRDVFEIKAWEGLSDKTSSTGSSAEGYY